MAKTLESVLTSLEDRLIIDQIGDAFVPIGRGAGIEKFLQAWNKLWVGRDHLDEPQELPPLDSLTEEEQSLVGLVMSVYPAIKVWGTLSIQRKQKIASDLKNAIYSRR